MSQKYGKRCKNSFTLFLIVSECSNAGPYIYNNLFQNIFFQEFTRYRKTRTCVCLWLRARMCCLPTCCLVVVLHSLRVRLGYWESSPYRFPASPTLPLQKTSISLPTHKVPVPSHTLCFILKSSRELDWSVHSFIDWSNSWEYFKMINFGIQHWFEHNYSNRIEFMCSTDTFEHLYPENINPGTTQYIGKR